MDQIEIILRRLRENEEIQQKFHLLESRIISILNFRDFFEILLIEMQSIFNVPYVWLSVIEESHLSDLIHQLNDSAIISQRSNLIKKSDFADLVGPLSSPLLINSDLDAYEAFFPEKGINKIKSIAIAPVQIDGEIVGTLNQGDVSIERFEPGMDISSLEQLMLKISLCLSNVAAHEKLQYCAYHDPLTGLLNRRAFELELHREFSRSKRYSGNLSLIFLDLDSFKQINDQFGHDNGDHVLKFIADSLQLLSREEDVVARFAGDEFVIILPETSNETSAVFMKRVQDYLDHHPVCFKGNKLRIFLSYGVASTEEAEISGSDDLFKKADERLYLAKAEKVKNLKSDQKFVFN